MSKKSSKPIRSEAELVELTARAKDLYFSYTPFNDIAKQLGVSSATVADWRKVGGWDVTREGIERGILEDAFGARRMTLSRITKMSTDLLEAALRRLSDRVEPPTLAEAEKLSVIVGNLDKILRLDMGKATDNVAVQTTVQHSVEEIRARLQADPVIGYAIEMAGQPRRIEAVEAVVVEKPELLNE